METKSQAIVKEIKELKEKKDVLYTDILEETKVNGSPAVSMTTLRRVLANGSENRANSFKYEETLLPILTALKRIAGSSDDTPEAKEISKLKAIITVQNEELDRVTELKEHLETRIDFITGQITEKDALIKRLIDRLDQKDEIISQFIMDLRQKDTLINCMMDKLKKHENS